jgi:hypothetical protein
MRVLEARFHPWRKARGPFLVVAQVICRRRRAVVQPTAASQEQDPASPVGAMVQKLEYLVGRNSPDPFHRLSQLRSDFWSFVEVDQ